VLLCCCLLRMGLLATTVEEMRPARDYCSSCAQHTSSVRACLLVVPQHTSCCFMHCGQQLLYLLAQQLSLYASMQVIGQQLC
jgi:hypothetical protein